MRRGGSILPEVWIVSGSIDLCRVSSQAGFEVFEVRMYEDGVFWIQGDPHIKLAVVLRPESEGLLEGDLRRYHENGVEIIVSLLEWREAHWLGLSHEGTLAHEVGMEFLSYPIPDVHLPVDPPSFRTFVAGLADRLRAGQRIGVHCRGSIGRATVTAACTLIHLGWKPEAALQAIEAARGCEVPDTQEQYEWILTYRA
jgi:hypothetical protein